MNERIKELRKFLGLSGEKFGEKLGITRGAVSNIENGSRNVTEQIVKSICREFGVSEQWLRTGEGEMLVPVTQNDKVAQFVANAIKTDNSFVLSTIEAMADLSPEELKVIEKFMHSLSK